ncbi:FecR family protein [Mucilaginibacter sp. AW1-3]
MSVTSTRLAYLFNSYFEKTATPAETQELFGLLALSEDDEQLTALMRQAWDNLKAEDPVFTSAKSEKIIQSILYAPAEDNIIHMNQPRLGNTWRRYAAAAAVLLLAGAGLFYRFRDQKPVIIQQAKISHDAAPGGNKAILTLANGSTIALDNARNGVVAKQGNSLVNKTANGQLVYNASETTANEVPLINKVTTPRGGQYHIVLPDGSEVWLNAASSIKYPTIFNGKTRPVEITGEVYFEVAKNAAKPFIVKTGRADIEVLGTHFNIMAYNDEDAMRTTLLEGSVKITTNKGASRILKPGQQVILNDMDQLIMSSDVDVEEEVAWKNGLFLFRDADIKSIMREAARWYDVNIVYEGTVPVKQYNGRISRNVQASALLNMLKYTGVNATIEGKNIYIKN